MNICESLSATARLLPENVAIVYQGQSITYETLNQLSIAAAKILSEAGVGKQDRVALVLPNSIAFPVWYYATLRIGAIAVSINTRLSSSEVEFILGDCKAAAVVCADGSNVVQTPVAARMVVSIDGRTCDGHELVFNEFQDNDWVDDDPDAPALILYTSGTTGFPKGATLSHQNVRSNVFAFNHLCNMQPHDRVLLAVPLFHCFGQNALLNSVLNVGGTLVVQQKFDLNETKQLISDHRITQLYGVPTMFQLLLDSCSPEDLSTVNYCFSAAAPLSIQTSQSWLDKFGLPINEGYGLTETSPFASYNHRFSYKIGSIGSAIDLVEMKVVDPETAIEKQPGELGEIAIRGPNVMLGYWNRPQETGECIRNGWFHSGDIGRMDDQGMFYLVDRVKDMIAVGGLKVFPAEVERVLNEHPAVFENAVVGIQDPVMGEKVVAFVVLEQSNGGEKQLQINSLVDHAKSQLGSYKLPRKVIIVDELPRNPSGKILKTRLREMASENTDLADSQRKFDNQPQPDSQTSDVPPGVEKSGEPILGQRSPALRKIMAQTYASNKVNTATEFLQDLICQITNQSERPAPKTTFVDAGMDSLMIVEMSAELQKELGENTELPATLIFDHPRICDMAEFLVGEIDTTNAAASDPTLEKTAERKTLQNDLKTQISQLSEEQALKELLNELD